MKVSVVGPHPPHEGGIAQHAARVVEALTDLGHDVHVVSWRSQYPRLLYRGKRPTEFPAGGNIRWVLRWWDPISWLRARRETAHDELLVLPWTTPFHALPYAVLTSRRRTRAVALVHNVAPHERFPLARLLSRAVLARFDGAVVHSRAVQADLRALVPHLPSTLVRLPPNIDLRRSPLPRRPPTRLLFFGLVRPYKGLDVALDAVSHLRRKGVHLSLTVAGSFWEPVDRYRQRVAQLELRDVVTLDDRYVPDAEVQSLLDHHHIIVAPYRTATQSAIVPLAHAVGRPVVASAVGGLLEYVRDGVDGSLARPGDAKSLADAIERAMILLDRPTSNDNGDGWADVARSIIAASIGNADSVA